MFKENYDPPFKAAVVAAEQREVSKLPRRCEREEDYKVLYYGVDSRRAAGRGPDYTRVGKVSLGWFIPPTRLGPDQLA